ncbi:MAG: hypothetical protein EAX95_04960 [Candidatus Thorarchaeota archaeon]|nr:hypothetical protein [Candidatus Thorarchaeota archaeon]
MISTVSEVIQLLILILTAAFFIIAIEYRKLSFSVIAFAVANGVLSLSFVILGAPYVAFFNCTVFSGAFAILFLTTMNLDEPTEAQDNPDADDRAEVTP